MALTIWDLKEGDEFRLHRSDDLCITVSPTEDGMGLLGRYVDGKLKGLEDFIFEDEIAFN